MESRRAPLPGAKVGEETFQKVIKRMSKKITWIVALLVGVAGLLHAQEMDEALRGRDLSRVLSLLQPTASEPEADAEAAAEGVPEPEMADLPAVEAPRVEQPEPTRPLAPVRVEPIELEEGVPELLPEPEPAPVAPHRVTVVAPDGSVREAQPTPSLVVPMPAVVPAVSEAPSPSGAPAQVGARPILTRVPKVAPPRAAQTATAPPPRMPRPEPASMELDDVEDDLALHGDDGDEPLLPEQEARARAAGLLSELMVPGIEEAVPPDEEPPETAPGVGEVGEAEPTDPGEEPSQPLGLLDQLAGRLTEISQPAEAAAPEQVEAPPPEPPQPRDPSTDPRDERIDQIRVELDSLLRATRIDVGLPAEAPGFAATPDPGGWRYSGQWRSGKMDGVGTLSYADGWSFTGDWRDGRISGSGVLRFPDGSVYDGEWADGRMDGFGVFTFPDGWRYVGQWRAGRMHGTGELIHPQSPGSSTL